MDPLALVPAVHEEVRALDTDVPVSRVQTMNEVVRASTSTERLNVVLFGFFGVLALLLVSVGVYGVVMAYQVSTRTLEVGIRMALGARPRTVLRSFLGQGLLLAVVGVGLGAVGALATGRMLSGMLYDLSWYDPATLVAVAVIVVAVALGASNRGFLHRPRTPGSLDARTSASPPAVTLRYRKPPSRSEACPRAGRTIDSHSYSRAPSHGRATVLPTAQNRKGVF
jgi:hypothetical protein